MIVCQDAFAFLARLADESVNLVVADPPYESLEKHRAVGTTTRLTNDWFPVIGNDQLPRLLSELWRVLKPNSHCYIFCDDETSNILWDVNRRLPTPFRWWKRVVWEKMALGMGYHYRASFEFIAFLEKGHRNLRDRGIGDVLRAEELSQIVRAKRIRNGFPTEKPVEVSEILIHQSSEPGDRVIDPFVGSGSVAVACTRLGRAFAGCDINSDAVSLASSRVKEALDFKPKVDSLATI